MGQDVAGHDGVVRIPYLQAADRQGFAFVDLHMQRGPQARNEEKVISLSLRGCAAGQAQLNGWPAGHSGNDDAARDGNADFPFALLDGQQADIERGYAQIGDFRPQGGLFAGAAIADMITAILRGHAGELGINRRFDSRSAVSMLAGIDRMIPRRLIEECVLGQQAQAKRLAKAVD